MADEIYWRHTGTGDTLYATIRNSARKYWATDSSDFETLAVADWTDYDIALTETPASSYFYEGDFPAIAGNMTAGFFWVDIYEQAGANPAIDDTFLGTMIGYWDGTTFGPWAGDARALSGDETAANTLELFAEALDQATGKLDSGTLADDTITAAAIAAAAIDNATFAADVGSTAYADNIIALAVRKVLDELNLDHLMKVAVANNTDLTAEVVDATVLSHIMSAGDTSVFVPTTDGLQPIRDKLPLHLEDLSVTDTTGFVATADTQKVDVNTVKTRPVGDVGAGNTFHGLQAADTGATTVARTGADSDTLETLSDQIDALPGAVAANTFNDQTYNGATGYTLTAGTLVSGTAADTLTIGTPLVFAPTAIAALDVDFEFELGTARVNELVVTGYYEGTTGLATSRYASVYMWDYLAAVPAWVLITDGSNRIPDGSSNVVMRYALGPQYQDPATGQVKVKYESSRLNANDRLYIDQHFVNGIVTGFTLDEIANAVVYYRMDPTIAQDGEHSRFGWFNWVQRPIVSAITDVTGSVVTGVAGTRFEAVDNLYVGHTIQFHLGGTNTYRYARVTAQTGAALTVDTLPTGVDTTYHFYILPERTITTAQVNTEMDTALNTAIPGSPTADSINERVATMDGYIDNIHGMTEDV